MLFLLLGLSYSYGKPSLRHEKTVPHKIIKVDKDLDHQDVRSLLGIFKTHAPFSQHTKQEDYYWVQLDFGEDFLRTSQDSILYLRFNTFDFGKLFFNLKGEISQKNIGQFDQDTNSQKIRWSNYHSYLKFSFQDLIAGRYLFLRVNRSTFLEDVNHWRFLYGSIPPNELISPNDKYNQTLYGLFAGICFIMLLSALSLFVLQKNREFLFYSVYLVILFIFLAGKYFGVFQFLLNNQYLEYWTSESFNFLANMAYCLFLIAYLETRKNYPIIHIICVTAFVTNLIILLIIVFFYSQDSVLGLIYIVKYSIVSLNFFGLLGAIYLAFIPKNKLVYFIASATIVLCFAGLARIFLAKPEDGLFLDSMHYMVIGSSVEVIIFAFGLNYKANTELHENYRLKEEALLNRIKVLRAQINPHFIFNSLSSIQYLISSHKVESSIKYLSKFSRLTRNILESSIEDKILLKNEIKILEDYLALESLRFDNSFSYKINVENQLESQNIEIPSMVIQPFLENALIHGLLPKKQGAKHLSINFKIENEFLICVVDDTGIGRDLSQKKSSIYRGEKKSRGMEITKLRLEALGEIEEAVKIMDKYDSEGRALGTTVIIRIPI